MKTYRVMPITQGSSWKIHGWMVKKDGWLGGSVLRKFSERQEAINYVKVLGDKNRPSQVLVFDNKGQMVSNWEYGERPRVRG